MVDAPKVEPKKEKAPAITTSTMIKPCDCKNEYQDSIYGTGMRVKNSVLGRSGSGSYRCTVCRKVS